MRDGTKEKYKNKIPNLYATTNLVKSKRKKIIDKI